MVLSEWLNIDMVLIPKWVNQAVQMISWIEGFENRMEFSLRVHLTLNRLIQQYPRKTIVVLTHGAFIQLSFKYFFGFGESALDRAMPEIRRTSITHWYQNEGEDRWNLERSNDCHHLSP